MFINYSTFYLKYDILIINKKRISVTHFIGGLLMTKTRIAINGFGRIGRMVFRQAILDDQLEVVAINASYPEETLAHLITYDSIHGKFEKEVEIVENGLRINEIGRAHV